MLSQILPRGIDNTYRGHKAALWIFGLLLFLKAGIGVSSIFNGYSAATTADGIPLDTYTPEGARTVVSMLAMLGLWTLVVCVLGLLALVRYRAMIPLMYVLFLLEQAGRKLVLYYLPIARSGGSSGSVVTLVIFAVMIIGLALSLWSREKLPAPD